MELALASTLWEQAGSSKDICQAGTGLDGYHRWDGTRGWHWAAGERSIPSASLQMEGQLVQQGLCSQTYESIMHHQCGVLEVIYVLHEKITT